MSEKPTREQILNEPAGRRLDGWVAEFMGLTLDPGGWWSTPEGDRIACADGGPWEYSTDIAEAWKVEEKIAARGLVDAYVQGLAEVLGMGGAEWEVGHWRYAHAAPDVRCRAVLLAVTPRPAFRWVGTYPLLGDAP